MKRNMLFQCWLQVSTNQLPGSENIAPPSFGRSKKMQGKQKSSLRAGESQEKGPHPASTFNSKLNNDWVWSLGTKDFCLLHFQTPKRMALAKLFPPWDATNSEFTTYWGAIWIFLPCSCASDMKWSFGETRPPWQMKGKRTCKKQVITTCRMSKNQTQVSPDLDTVVFSRVLWRLYDTSSERETKGLRVQCMLYNLARRCRLG